MLESQAVSKQQFIFDILLDNLLLQCAISPSSNFAHVHACIDALSNALTVIPDVRLQQSLQKLKEQLPKPKANRAIFESWWQVNHFVWNQELKTTISFYRDMQSPWHLYFSNHEILQRFYDANKSLIDFLDLNYELTVALCREIETALLSPEKELTSSRNEISNQ